MTEPAPLLIQPPRPRLQALDGLRGLAVFLVVLDHASDRDLRFFSALDMNRAGKIGVDLFFVLSAFLLAHLLLRQPVEELWRSETWKNYFLRRFLRIFPPYALALGVMFFFHHSEMGFGQIISHLLLLDGIRHFWTIPVEIKYYFLLPAVAIFLSMVLRKKWRAAVFAFCGMILVGGLLFWLERGWSFKDDVWLSRNVEPFLIGSLAALLHAIMKIHEKTLARFRWLPWLWEAAALVALGLALLRIPAFHNWIFPSVATSHKFKNDELYCGICWAVLLLCILHGRGLWRGIMEWMPLRWLGLISFSVYLSHIMVMDLTDDMPWPHPVVLLIFLAMAVAVGSLGYWLVERPLSRIRFRFRKVQVATPTLPAEA